MARKHVYTQKLVFPSVDNCTANLQFIRMSTYDTDKTKNEIVTHFKTS